MKRHISILLSIVLIIMMVGCGLSDSKDRQQVVAKVNGEKILKGEVLELFEQQKMYLGITNENEKDPDIITLIKETKIGILDHLITEKLMKQKAIQAGFGVDETYRLASKTELDNIVISISEDMRREDMAYGFENEEIDYIAIAQEYVLGQLDEMGWTMDYYINMRAEQLSLESFMEDTVKDIHAADSDIQSYYDKQLQDQLDLPGTGEGVKLYEPKQARIKYILFELTQEQLNHYYDLLDKDKSSEAEAFMDETLKDLELQADEVYLRITNGEDFDELVEIYASDIWTDEFEDGFMLSITGQTSVAELEEVIASLNKDEVSHPVSTLHGTYIVKVYETIPGKVYTIDEKRDEIKRLLDFELRNAESYTIIDQWLDDADITRFENRL